MLLPKPQCVTVVLQLFSAGGHTAATATYGTASIWEDCEGVARLLYSACVWCVAVSVERL